MKFDKPIVEAIQLSEEIVTTTSGGGATGYCTGNTSLKPESGCTGDESDCPALLD